MSKRICENVFDVCAVAFGYNIYCFNSGNFINNRFKNIIRLHIRIYTCMQQAKYPHIIYDILFALMT